MIKSNFFDAALTTEILAVRVAVIKNVPAITDLHDASVIVAAIVHWTLRRLVTVDKQIAVAHDRASIGKWSIRRSSHCIAKLMTEHRRINKIVRFVHTTDRGGLKKGMSLISGVFLIRFRRCHKPRCLFDRKHIFSKNGQHCAMPALIARHTKARVKIRRLTLCEHARIKLRLVALPLAKSRAVLIMHISVKFIGSGRCIADSHRNHTRLIQHVI